MSDAIVAVKKIIQKKLILTAGVLFVLIFASAYKTKAAESPNLNVSKTNLTITVGETIDISALVTVDESYDGELKYSISSGRTYLSIDGSVVTGTLAGTGRIRISALSTEKYGTDYAYVTIKVMNKPESDQEAFDMLAINSDESEGAVSKDGILYVRPSGRLALSINSATYDTASMTINTPANSEIKNEKGLVIDIPDNAGSGVVEGSFYLYDSEDPEIRTGNLVDGTLSDNNIPSGSVVIDADAPSVVFRSPQYSKYNDYNTQIYNNGKDGGTITVTDVISGIASVRFAVIEKNNESTEEAIGNAVENGNVSWQPITATTKNMYVNVSGSYVFIVESTDLVGNSIIKASDGTVIDMTGNILNFTDITMEQKQTADIPYEFEITTTGFELDSVTAELSYAGKTIRPTKDPAANSAGQFENAYELSDSRLSELTEDGYIKISGIIKSDAASSNNTVLTLTAKDRCGNLHTITRTFMLDAAAPEISLSYDTNARNEKYFNTQRTLTLSIKEQNFDASLISMNLSVNAKESYSYTLEEIENGKAEGISVQEKHTDTESEKEEIGYTANRLISYVLIFGRDESDLSVSFSLNGADTFGNSNLSVNSTSDAPYEFVIDKTAPVIDVAFKDADGKSINLDKENIIYGAAFTAEIDLRELNAINNSKTGKVQITLNQTDAEGKSINRYPETAVLAAQNLKLWTNEGDSLKFTMEKFEPEAQYELSISVTDLAGNTSLTGPYRFTVDRTAPAGDVTLSTGQTYAAQTDNLWFENFTSQNLTAAVNAEDSISGIEDISYALYKPSEDAKGTFKYDAYKNLTYKPYSEAIKLTDEGQYVLYIRMEDKAGNVSFINTQGIIIDKTAPTNPVIKVTSSDPGQGVYNGNVVFSIMAEDPSSGKTYAGLKSVTYTITTDGKDTQRGSFNNNFKDIKARISSYTGTGTVDAEKNNSNNVVITATAEDMAGNKSTQSATIAIDVTAPVIKVEYSTNEAVNGKYYNQSRIATITVFERNFDISKAVITTTTSGTSNAEIGNWSIASTGADTSANICRVSFVDDGDYTFTVNITDKAGNTASYGKTDEFVIDKTTPSATISFDNNDVKNEKYYNEARTATISIKEKNFSNALFSVDVDSNTGRYTPEVSAWKAEGEVHTKTIRFSSDGTYRIKLKGSDLAGNTISDITTPEFIIDTTTPDIKISGVENKTAYNNEIAPGVIYSDTNIDRVNSSVEIIGNKGGTLDRENEAITNGETVSYINPDIIIENDDVYKLKVKATDLAGNTAEEELLFSINRFGSNFVLADETTVLTDDYYNQKINEVVVYEVNVSGLEENKVSIGHNGTSEELISENEYSIKETDTEYNWKAYTYTIDEKPFSDNGHYDVLISTKDTAGNRQTNVSKGMPCEFIKDSVAPSLSVTGIEDGAYYSSGAKITISASDNAALECVNVYSDEMLLKTIQAEEIEDDAVTYELPTNDSFKTISVVAEDKAGNKEVKSYLVYVSEHFFRTFVSKYPWLITLVIAVAGGVIIIMVRKKELRCRK